MKKSIQLAFNEHFEKKCRFTSEAGFSYIAVNFTEFLDKTEDDWKRETENIGLILEKYNLACIQSHPYYYDLRISSELLEDKYEFAIKQAITASGKLGAEWCAIHPRSSVSTGFKTSQSLKDNQKVFYEYLELAHKYNTGIAAENLPIFGGINMIMHFYVHCYEDIANLVDSFNDERVGICWDTGHANMMCGSQADAIKFLGKRIKCTHIHNNDGAGDHHNPPDNGNIPWNDVMASFKEIGYDGPFTLETHCLFDEDELLKDFFVFNYKGLCCLERLYK